LYVSMPASIAFYVREQCHSVKSYNNPPSELNVRTPEANSVDLEQLALEAAT